MINRVSAAIALAALVWLAAACPAALSARAVEQGGEPVDTLIAGAASATADTLAPGRTLYPPPAAADTLAPVEIPAAPLPPAAAPGWQENDADLTADRLKELLRRETGDPEIEGSPWRRRKNPRVAMLCALAFPGLGQVYNEKPLKAIVAMGVETFYLLNILHWHRRERREQVLRDSYDRYVPCGPEGLDRCLNSRWRFHNAWMEEYKARKIDWVWWSSAAVLAIMIDAYVDAHLHDMRFRIESGPNGAAGLAVVVDF